MARCGRAEEEEVNVDTKQQSSNKVRTTEEEKNNRDIEERQRVFKYLFRILISQSQFFSFWIEL